MLQIVQQGSKVLTALQFLIITPHVHCGVNVSILYLQGQAAKNRPEGHYNRRAEG